MIYISEKKERFIRSLYEFCTEHQVYTMDGDYSPNSYWDFLDGSPGVEVATHIDDFSMSYRVHLDQQEMLDIIAKRLPEEVETHKNMALSQQNRKGRLVPRVTSSYVLNENGFHGRIRFLLYEDDGVLRNHTIELTIEEFDNISREIL